ncbi:MAG: hypothetical protein ACYC8T_29680, partial [Myxococcaceae bacterium]
MSPLRMLGLVALCAAAVASCGPPESKNPLSDPAQARVDPRLTGLWAGEVNGSAATLQFFPKKGAYVDVVLVGDDGDKGAAVLTFDAFPTALAGKSYLNLRAKTFAGPYGENPSLAAEYIFARYEVGKDGALTLWTMDDAPVKAAVKAGKLKGTAGESTAKLTASTAELAEFVRGTDGEKLFTRLA